MYPRLPQLGPEVDDKSAASARRSTCRRFGPMALGILNGMRTGNPAAATHALQQWLVNPIVKTAWKLGIPPPGDALLETVGRRTGQPRLTPVCDGLDGQTFWLVAQAGHRADWVRNIEANPRVRVKVASWPRTRWRTGTARILDDDDPGQRQQVIGRANVARWLCICTSKALDTSPVTVRIDLDARG